MTAPGVFTPYSTVRPFLAAMPEWVPVEHQERIAAYQKYEEIYWGGEEGFIDLMRGDNDNPVLMPTARTFVNTVNRYTVPKLSFTVEPSDPTVTVSPDLLLLVRREFEKLFQREGFYGKFEANKIEGLRKGDWLFHVIADERKPLGRRVSIYPVDAASYFPVTDPDDPDKIVKVHLAERIDYEGETRISRLTYTRVFDANGVQTGITRSHGIFEEEGWLDATSPEVVVLAEEPLPEDIPAIPVYHIKNGNTTAPFGDSELRGLESPLLDVNQVMSDESAALALDGIGVYATEGGAPLDEQGRETDFILGPGRVLTNTKNFKRITGVGSVQSFGDHYERLFKAIQMVTGSSDVAVGRSSGQQPSGIALLLELGPILAHTGILDTNILAVLSQMFHDLVFWLAYYEEQSSFLTNVNGSMAPAGFSVIPHAGQKVPHNREQVVKEVVDLRSTLPPTISLQTAHSMLRAVGLPVSEDEIKLLAEEMALLSGSAADPEGEEENRRAEELA